MTISPFFVRQTLEGKQDSRGFKGSLAGRKTPSISKAIARVTSSEINSEFHGFF